MKVPLGASQKKIGKPRIHGGGEFVRSRFTESILHLRRMGHKKLKRFAEIRTFQNVLEYPENTAGKWSQLFKNNQPVILELACGKGEYAIGLAQLHPNKNFIGVDIKGNRIWVGAKKAFENDLKNVAFLRTQIQMIDQYFEKSEVDEIWITFPDPQLRNSRASKRLTHPRFLRLYKKILQPGAKIHLKTDSPDLYNFTKTVIDLYKLTLILDLADVHKNEAATAELKIITHYEKLDIAKSKTVFYLCFSLPGVIMDSDDLLDNALKKEGHENH